MKAQELKEAVVRFEAFADGFKSGVANMAQWVAAELAKEEDAKKKNEANS